MNKRIVFDCDNTMGVPDCDVDDGLALLFLLDCPEVSLEAVCSTYGNNTLEVVHGNTERLLADHGIEVPLYRGAASADAPDSEAGRFLARIAAENPGEIHVLATGSLTNLKGASLADPNFFSNVASVTVMGGITEPLLINDTPMDELNFSCDPEALRMLVEAPCAVNVLTAQNCLDAYFNYADFREIVGGFSWMYRECQTWFRWMYDNYGIDSYICWDVAAAAYCVHPEWFEDAAIKVALDDEAFSIGMLRAPADGEAHCEVNAPRVLEPSLFVRRVLDAWGRSSLRLK